MLFDKLDCEKHVNDVQCQHETFSDSPMNGAGHHVREKIQNPIIGVMTQPVHPDADDDLWTDEFKRIQQRMREEKTAAEGWND